MSALEIYNEVVRDLLRPDSGPLRLLDDPERGTVVERLAEEVVRSSGHLYQILEDCEGQSGPGWKENAMEFARLFSRRALSSILDWTIASDPRTDW